jgi:hypothetical protein
VLGLTSTRRRNVFPLTLDPNAMDGPYPESACRSIQEHIRGRHECIVAEVFYEGDLTARGETPGSSDNLAQRNSGSFTFGQSGVRRSRIRRCIRWRLNRRSWSGKTQSRRISFTREQGANMQAILTSERGRESFRLDELLFRWHNLPTASTVTLTFSAPITTTMLLSLAQLRLSPLAVRCGR